MELVLEVLSEIRSVQRSEDLGDRLIAAGCRLGLWERASFSAQGHIEAFPDPGDSLLALLDGHKSHRFLQR